MHRPLYDSRCNSFHLLRFVLALLILWTHAFTLLGYASPLGTLTGGQLSESSIAVDGFLVISGFFIAQSAERQRNALTFLRSRFLRIYPALTCAVLFTALIVGGLAYSGTYHDYLRLGVNGPLYYIRHWLTLNVQAEPWGITGVFAQNPTQGVNVSLWTVKHEVSLYLLVALLMLTHLHRKKGVYIGFAAVFGTLFLLYEGFGVQLWRLEKVQGWVINTWNYAHFVRTGLFFFLGTLLYLYRDWLPKTWWFAVLMTGLLVVSGFVGGLEWAHVLITPYLIVRLGVLRSFDSFRRMGDLSFGLYVFSYPIQQLLLHIWPTLSPLALFGASLLPALGMAFVSWRCVERRALRLAGRNL